MFSEEGLPLGKVLNIPESAVRGAEEVTKLAVRLWEEAYEELAADLGEGDLAGAIRTAVSRPVPTSPAAGDNADDEGAGTGAAKSGKYSWSPVGGWWVERPALGRAVASC